MARARNIKPSFFENEELVECSFAARLCFIGLWTLADREGRLEDRPRKIKMALFPDDDVKVDGLLDELSRVGLIVRYAAQGMSLISIPKFTKHQRPHQNESASDLPGPDEAQDVSALDHGAKGCEPEDAALRPVSPSLNADTCFPHTDGAQGAHESDDDAADQQALAPAEPKPAKQSQGSEAFERWWQTLPSEKKVKKRNAYQIWKRKRLDDQAETLIADVQHRLANDRRWIEGYIPDPTTYLNQERWNDAVQQPRSGSSQNEQAGEEFLRRIGASNA